MDNMEAIWGGKPRPSYKIVSWYTPTYERVALRFVDSLRAVGIDPVMYRYESTGNWYDNVARKPDFMLRAMGDYRGHNIVYLDADAVVHERPLLFDNWTGEMLGAHYRERPGREPELLGGTLYIKNCQDMRDFFRDCKARMEVCAEAGNPIYCQQAMAQLLPLRPEITVKRLPVEYCTIFDGVDRPASGIVIEHMQESRRQRHGSV